MMSEFSGSAEFPPDAHITMIAEAILLRASLIELRDDRQANWDRLAGMRQPTMGDVESADDLQALNITAYTTARMQNADDLAILTEAVDLVDRAVDILEEEPTGLTLLVEFALARLRHCLADIQDYRDLEEPLDDLSRIIVNHLDS